MTGRGLRIVAGSLKGRRLRVPASAAVRPTPERVREALFSILGSRTQRARVLDAFAGSGALGFEALSRGAAGVSFIESDRHVAAALRNNAATLGLTEACDIVIGSLPDVVSKVGRRQPFDVILADPPYAAPLEVRERTLEALARVLVADGLLVWERQSRGQPVLVAPLIWFESRKYGNTALDLYSRAPDQGVG